MAPKAGQKNAKKLEHPAIVSDAELKKAHEMLAVAKKLYMSMYHYLESRGMAKAYEKASSDSKKKFMQSFAAHHLKKKNVEARMTTTKAFEKIDEAGTRYEYLTKKEMVERWGVNKAEARMKVLNHQPDQITGHDDEDSPEYIVATLRIYEASLGVNGMMFDAGEQLPDAAAAASAAVEIIDDMQGCIVMETNEEAKQGAQSLGKMKREKEVPQNASRDALRAIGWPSRAPKLKYIELPFVDGKKQHPVFDPADFFQHMEKNCPEWFQKGIVGEEGEVEKFWAGMRGTPRTTHLEDDRDLTRTIPLGMHADGAPYSKTDSVFTVCWSSLTGSGATLGTRLIITVMRKCEMMPETLEELFKYMAWSFNSLHHGVWPEDDWRGLPLGGKKSGSRIAGAWIASMIQIRGDWEFYSDALSFPRWNQDGCCFMCTASRSDPARLYTDRNGRWRHELRDHQGFVALLRERGKKPSEIFKIFGLRMESVMIDTLHTVDQGVASHVCGNVLWEALSLMNMNQGEALEEVEKRLRAWYKVNPRAARVQGKLSIERLRTQGEWPKLKAKGAATRWIVKFCLEMAREARDAGTIKGQRRIALCEKLLRFYEIIAEEGGFLGDDAKKELPDVGRAVFGLYSTLAVEALEAGRGKMYKMVPKFHHFLHVTGHQALVYGNPRYYWCYSDEDLQGHSKGIAASCHPTHFASTHLLKWAILMFCR